VPVAFPTGYGTVPVATPFLLVGAIISPSLTDTKSIISPAPKLSPKMLKDTEMTTNNPNTKP